MPMRARFNLFQSWKPKLLRSWLGRGRRRPQPPLSLAPMSPDALRRGRELQEFYEAVESQILNAATSQEAETQRG